MKSNTYLALEEFSKIDSMDETIADINFILEGFTHVIQSIYDEKPTLGEGEVFTETLSIKILLATKSIIQICDESVFITQEEMLTPHLKKQNLPLPFLTLYDIETKGLQALAEA